jgi:hypothetical protein
MARDIFTNLTIETVATHVSAADPALSKIPADLRGSPDRIYDEKDGCIRCQLYLSRGYGKKPCPLQSRFGEELNREGCQSDL